MPLVGRDSELARLDAAFATAADGSGRIAVVSGPAGIGKTSLVAAACHRFAGRDALVLTGGCPPGWAAGVAYGPFLTAWRGAPGRDGVEGFTGLLSGLGDLGQLPGEVAHAWLGERVLARIAEWSATRPVVLVVEDAHWLDPASAAIVELLARAAASLSLLLVLTARDDSSAATARLVELAAAPGGLHLPLEPLAPAATAALARAVAGQAAPDELIAAVVRRSEGHPLFAHELSRRPDERLPATLRLLLLHRLRALGPSGVHVVAAVSMAGQPTSEGLIDRVCGPGAAAAVRAAVRDGLLAHDPAGGALRARHVLVAEVAEGELLPDEARRLHRALAEAFTDADPAVLAAHWEAAGEPGRALPAWLAGGELAMRRAAYEAAAEAYRRALALFDGGAATGPASRAEAVLAAATAVRLSGAADEAIRLLRAELVGGRATDPATRCLLLDRLRDHLYAAGQSSAAFAALAEARELSGSVRDPALAARLAAAEGSRLMLTGRYADGARTSRAAAAKAEVAGDPDVRARALATHGVCLALAGDEAGGVRSLTEARAVAQAHGSIPAFVLATTNLAYVLLNATRYAEAAAVCRETLDRLRAYGVAEAYGADLRCNLAASLVALGRWDEGIEVCDRARAGGKPTKAAALLLLCRAEIAARRGDEARAAELLSIVDGFEGDNGIVALEAAYAAAVAQRSAGRPRLAVATCQRALAELADLGAADRLRLAALAMGALADLETGGGRVRKLDDPAAVAAQLAKLADEAVSELGGHRSSPEAAALAAHCTAERTRLATPDPPRWAAAVHAWDAAGLPWHAANARLRWAEALTARRDYGPVAEALREAHRAAVALLAEPLREQVERAARRARVPLVGAAGSARPVVDILSRREREVLELLAWGRTNKEIAGTLVISVRTAGVHVSHILAKLGAANRAEAARVARDLLANPDKEYA